MSIADLPATLGSFKINSTTFDVTAGMSYGTPPVDTLYGDLQYHGIFPTFYTETGFSFKDSIKIIPAINVSNTDTQKADMYLRSFSIDLSGLAQGYGIHFDLYNLNAYAKASKGIQYDISEFAPFSHDAEGINTAPPPAVPEPGTAALVGLGLVGLAFYKRRNRK